MRSPHNFYGNFKKLERMNNYQSLSKTNTGKKIYRFKSLFIF